MLYVHEINQTDWNEMEVIPQKTVQKNEGQLIQEKFDNRILNNVADRNE